VCAQVGLRPNAISLIGIVFAGAACGLILLGAAQDVVARAGCWVSAAVLVQLRLLCNMLDGLVAVEENMGSQLGILYNELPDRFEDCLILVCTGFACSVQPLGVHLGWLAAVLAVLTAYIMGFAGGLVMSAVKRDIGVKDYGTIITGHGGMVDRIDSLCFAAPVFFHVTRFFFAITN
jgi:CDP-diglyceride synthetase